MPPTKSDIGLKLKKSALWKQNMILNQNKGGSEMREIEDEKHPDNKILSGCSYFKMEMPKDLWNQPYPITI